MTPTLPLAAVTFAGVESPLGWALLVAAGAAVLVATYWGIVRRSGNPYAWLLMALRGVGLAALLLILAKPTWTRETTTVDPGRVAVVLDTSLSMSLTDPNASSRYVLARAAVEKVTRGLESRHGGRVAVDRFDITGTQVTDWPEQPAAERTDLVKALSDATAKLRSRPLVGVVLVSDGMDNTGRSDFRELAGLPGAPPVYTVGFPAAAVGDELYLALGKVRAPARAMVGNDIKIDVPVRKSGGPAVSAVVQIRRGKDVLATQKVSLPAGPGEQSVSVPFKPTQPGSFVFTAAVESDAGERTLANNASLFPLRVDAEKIRVLYVEGFLRPEYKFLKTHLEDDPDVDLTTEVRRLNPEGKANGAFARGLFTPDKLKSVDVVILGDLEGDFLDPAGYQALVQWLDGKSHSLLVLGGYHSFGPEGFGNSPLRDALPITFASKPPFQHEIAFAVELTDDGRRHPAFELSSDRAQSEKAWKEAPSMLGHAVAAGAKPAATVLAVNPSLQVGGKPAVIAAVQRFGGGYTMALTADTTWRWSRFPRVRGAADTLYARFWSQTVRWLAGRGLDDQRPVLTVSTDRPDYEVNRPVQVRVLRQANRPDLDVAGAALDVEVTTPRGKTVALPVKNSTAEPDAFTGTFYPSEGGRFGVAATLRAKGGATAVANQSAEFLVQGADLELANPGTNPELLESIARTTGGAAFDVRDVDGLPAKVATRERKTVQVQRLDLWNSWWLFGAFLTAVSLEWVIRRRSRMV
jgi:hypothetical protein